MPDRVYWCPFCHVPPYKSQGNLTNHIEENHEPQKHHRCLDCGRSWNTKLGRTRHVSRTNCSRQRFETTHHSDKKSLYACGICNAVFDDFALRQEHLLNHQQSGMLKAAWTKDTMMHSLLSYPSISATWNLLVSQTVPYLNPDTLSWNWSDCRATKAMEALEHKLFNSDQELRDILDDVLATLDERYENGPDTNPKESRCAIKAAIGLAQ